MENKKLIPIIVYFTVFLFCLWGCCDDDSPKVMCGNGYEEVDGSCACPDGKYSAYGFCRELAADEWYAVLDGCICRDTLFFKIVEIDGSIVRYKINDKIFVEAPNNGFWLAGAGGDMDYYPLPDGDSLASQGFPYGELICNADYIGAAEYMGSLFGKFTPSKDTLNMKIIYSDFQFPTIIVDSCFVTFTR